MTHFILGFTLGLLLAGSATLAQAPWGPDDYDHDSEKILRELQKLNQQQGWMNMQQQLNNAPLFPEPC